MTSKHFDVDGALARVDQDPDLLVELIEVFWDEYKGLITDLRVGVQKRDPSMIARKAHSLKSALGNIGAVGAYDCSVLLEQSAQEGNVAASDDLVLQIEREVAAFRREFDEFRKGI